MRVAERKRVADVTGGWDEDVARQVLDQVDRDHRVGHREFDLLALAGALLVEERGEHAVEQVKRGGLVGDEGRDELQCAARPVLQADQAGRGLDDLVVGGPVGARRAGRETLRVRVDQAREAFAQLLVAEAEPVERGCAHVGDEDVGVGEQGEEVFAAAWGP